MAPGHLMTWLDHIHTLRTAFSNINFRHIFWEINVQVDTPSKKGLTWEYGTMNYDLVDATRLGAVGVVSFY